MSPYTYASSISAGLARTIGSMVGTQRSPPGGRRKFAAETRGALLRIIGADAKWVRRQVPQRGGVMCESAANGLA